MNKAPFFLVGTGRCGTNMLRNMLVIHPRIRICPETHFLPVLFDKFGFEPITFEQYYNVITEHYDSSGNRWVDIILRLENKAVSDFRDSFQDFCRHTQAASIAEFTMLFYRYLYGENSIIGDKTPHYGTFMINLKKLWPNAKFIHIVRDGVYAAKSMTRHTGFIKMINAEVEVHDLDRCSYKGRIHRFSDPPVDIREAAFFWQKIVLEIRRQAEFIDSKDYLEIQYETLIKNSYKSLVTISEFLDFEPDRKWLKSASNLPIPFTLSRTEKSLTPQVYRDISKVINSTLKLYDYPIDLKFNISFKDYFKIITHPLSAILNKLRYLSKLIKNA